MNRSVSARLTRLEERLQPSCGTCYGAGGLAVMVPADADPDTPEWRPATCPECGLALHTVQQIHVPGDVPWDDDGEDSDG